ncbi:MAG: carbon-nitrogen hydrolase family protein [Candidatus Heimdallarchaeota archaeon]|nr:carbon-nitrogen hydrolase family protein [Candidatus Heimdallarchaeota archaeon]MCK4954014.1 carbon-nitrogen hydrolase family protein [Candidatus Heimdallarchaeota archaeon]
MIRVASIQISPVFLNAQKTWEKLSEKIIEAKSNGADLVTWGETLIPGYPQWVSPSGGAKFNDPQQKKVYAKYWQEAIKLTNSSIIQKMKALAKKLDIMFMGGIAEKDGGSIYCCLLTIGQDGEIKGRHRKLKPTYEERLVWADGDRLGLKTHDLKNIKVGGLNCWENWLPLARVALHLQEEILHIAVWPGSSGLTEDITRFIALEGRSWVVSTSGLLRPIDFAHLDESEFPMKNMMESRSRSWQNGGSVIVDPKGDVVAGPLIDEEGIIYADVDPLLAIQERQNFDISGHYSRFDLFNKP